MQASPLQSLPTSSKRPLSPASASPKPPAKRPLPSASASPEPPAKRLGSSIGYLLSRLTNWRNQALLPNCTKNSEVFLLAKGSRVGIEELQDIPGFKVLVHEGHRIPFKRFNIRKSKPVDLARPHQCFLFAGRLGDRIRISVCVRNLEAC